MCAKPQIFTLKNKNGMTMKVSNLGGIVMSLTVPDKNGKFENVVLEFDKPEDHLKDGYISALIGRVGNRIAKGKFTLDGKEYKLALNSGEKPNMCCLHGGDGGYDSVIWDARQFDSSDGPAIEFTRLSPAGEGGFPGNLFVRVVYTLMDTNAWRIQYWAMTDAPTVVNLTHHAYFNLNGAKKPVDDHFVQLFCDRYTAVGPGLIPNGKVLPVHGTPLDFLTPHQIGERVNAKHPTIKVAGGYDHNFVISKPAGASLSLCAVVEDEESGRQMETWTTEPCVQFYTGNFLDEKNVIGKGGRGYGKRMGFCLETQHAPDSPNQAGFPSIRLNPGEVYQSTTIYQFYTVEE